MKYLVYSAAPSLLTLGHRLALSTNTLHLLLQLEGRLLAYLWDERRTQLERLETVALL
jgi:hypothetical protein